MIKRIGKFIKLTGRERVLFLEALFLHLWIGLLLKAVPFRWIPQIFASRQSAVGSRQLVKIEEIRDAIQRAGKVSPWKNRCLVSSLAGRCMLRRRKISSQLSLGVAKNTEGKTIAHAWLKAGDMYVLPGAGEFTELYIF